MHSALNVTKKKYLEIKFVSNLIIVERENKLYFAAHSVNQRAERHRLIQWTLRHTDKAPLQRKLNLSLSLCNRVYRLLLEPSFRRGEEEEVWERF